MAVNPLPVAIMSHGVDGLFITQPDGFLTKDVSVLLPNQPQIVAIILNIFNTQTNEAIVADFILVPQSGGRQYAPSQLVPFQLVGLPPNASIEWQTKLAYFDIANNQIVYSTWTVDRFFTTLSGTGTIPGRGIPIQKFSQMLASNVVLNYQGPAASFFAIFAIGNESTQPFFQVGLQPFTIYPQQLSGNAPIQVPIGIIEGQQIWDIPPGTYDAMIAIYDWPAGKILYGSQIFPQAYTAS